MPTYKMEPVLAGYLWAGSHYLKNHDKIGSLKGIGTFLGIKEKMGKDASHFHPQINLTYWDSQCLINHKTDVFHVPGSIL